MTFDDGTTANGCLLVACDGGNSRVRRALFPQLKPHKLPICTMGLKADFSPREVKSLRAMDPFFLQAAASGNDTFMYFSGAFYFSPGSQPLFHRVSPLPRYDTSSTLQPCDVDPGCPSEPCLDSPKGFLSVAEPQIPVLARHC